MEMEERMFKVYASGDEKIQLKVIPGTFCNPAVPHQSLSGDDDNENTMCGGFQDCKISFHQI